MSLMEENKFVEENEVEIEEYKEEKKGGWKKRFASSLESMEKG